MSKAAARQLASCRAVELPSGEVPEWVHLVPYGSWQGHHSGRPITVGPAQAEQIVANFEKRRIDMVIDWEHQTILSMTNGLPAPGAAWVDEQEIRDDGVWGHVREWTVSARGHLERREYRFLSPTIEWESIDPVTGAPEGMRIVCAALTNIPFFAGDLRPVLNRSNGAPMDAPALFVALLTLLGLAAESTPDQVFEAVKGLKEMEEPPADPVMAAKAELGAAACTAMQWEADKLPKNAKVVLANALKHEGFVPEGEVLTLRAELAQAKEGGGVDRLVAQGLESGKIVPALQGHFKAMATRDLAAARAWLDAAPVIVELGSAPVDPKKGKTGVAALSPSELAACRALQMTPEQYLKGRKAS